MRSWAGVMAQAQIKQAEYSLAKIGILVGLPPDALERIQRRCSWRHYEPGEPIVDYLDSSDNVFFITEGEARVTIYSLSGKAVSFRELFAGDMFGEFPAIDHGPRSASVEARTRCLIASMPAPEFRELLQKEWPVAEALLRKLVITVRALTTRVYEFSTLAVNNRIQAELFAAGGVRNLNHQPHVVLRHALETLLGGLTHRMPLTAFTLHHGRDRQNEMISRPSRVEPVSDDQSREPGTKLGQCCSNRI
jgi:CRP-like cAMP-binding protein